MNQTVTHALTLDLRYATVCAVESWNKLCSNLFRWKDTWCCFLQKDRSKLMLQKSKSILLPNSLESWSTLTTLAKRVRSRNKTSVGSLCQRVTSEKLPCSAQRRKSIFMHFQFSQNLWLAQSSAQLFNQLIILTMQWQQMGMSLYSLKILQAMCSEWGTRWDSSVVRNLWPRSNSKENIWVKSTTACSSHMALASLWLTSNTTPTCRHQWLAMCVQTFHSKTSSVHSDSSLAAIGKSLHKPSKI